MVTSSASGRKFVDVFEKGKDIGAAMFDKEILVEERGTFVFQATGWLIMHCVKLDARFRPEMVEVAERLRPSGA